MSCFLTSLLRVMSFASLTAFAVGDFNLKTSLDGEDDISGGRDEFFDKSMIVLFDLPDFSIISAYMLLVIVWAESFLLSRRHWMSSVRYRRTWLLGYLVFNALLYAIQVALYSFLLLPSINTEIMSDLIYITLTCLNLVFPLIWFLIYIYLTMEFAGFPYASPSAIGRLRSLSKLAVLWTVCRLVWGFVALTTVLNRLVISYHRSPLGYSIQMICIFIFTEILPIAISLKDENLHALTEASLSSQPSQLPQAQRQIIPPMAAARINPNMQLLNPHDVNTRYSFTGSEDLSNTIWMDSYAGGGALYNQELQSAAKVRVSLSDPFPPPSPNWTRKSIATQSRHSIGSIQPRGSGDHGSLASLISPRSSVTSEHPPRFAGGWLWWLGL